MTTAKTITPTFRFKPAKAALHAAVEYKRRSLANGKGVLIRDECERGQEILAGKTIAPPTPC